MAVILSQELNEAFNRTAGKGFLRRMGRFWGSILSDCLLLGVYEVPEF